MRQAPNNLKVLCVDDDAAMRRLVEEAVQALGYEPIIAGSAGEALAALARHHRDIVAVVTDLNMPGGGGLELRRDALAQYRDIPFVVLSGYVTREIALRGVEEKIAAFLEKPAGLDDLGRVLTRETEARIATIAERAALEGTFFEEAQSILEDLEPVLVALEARPGDADALNAAFRFVHTIKGASGVLDNDTVYKFAHGYEDLLAKLKSGGLAPTPRAFEAVLRGFDLLRDLIAAASSGKSDPRPLDQLLATIVVLPDDVSAPLASAAHTDVAAPVHRSDRDDVKVPTSTLDNLMELCGEITVIRNMVNKLVRAVESNDPGNKDVVLLGELLEEMHKINGGMQAKLGEVRKIPLSTILRPLPRAVRDLSRTLGKDIELQLDGQHIRVDTMVGQVLSDSLIHLIRNAADHGLETTEGRRAAGKSPRGLIRVTCREVRDEVEIEIADDGRGIDTARIRAKLVERGDMTAESAARLPESELLQRILAPGFSTAATVSTISGRGVGTDMVLTSVRRLKGSVDISTKLGVGTCFTLKLPVPKSVLIINSLLVEAAGKTFALPQDAIVRLVRASKEDRQAIRKIGDTPFLDVDGRLLPLVSLRSLLGLASADPMPDGDIIITIVRTELAEFGLVVDAILDSEEIVVKRVGTHIERLDAFAGATFLGDGSVGLILDVDGIARLANLAQVAAIPARVNEKDAAKQARDYLVYRAHSGSLLASPLDQVHRLEVLPVNALRRSGNQCVVIYRDKLMPLWRLTDLMGDDSEGAEREMIPALVLEHGGRAVGFLIDSFLDVVRIDDAPARLPTSRPFVVGTLLLEGGPATVLDLEILIAQAMGTAKPGGDVEILSKSLAQPANLSAISTTPVVAMAALMPQSAVDVSMAPQVSSEEVGNSSAWGLF